MKSFLKNINKIHLIIIISAIIIGFATAGLHQATGEVLPKWGEFPILSTMWRSMSTPDASASHATGGERAWQRPTRKRKQLLAMVISARPQEIADRVLQELKRGVTALHGRGMYAGQERDVLMIAVTITEMQHLKTLVKSEDPNAFIVVAPAQEVLGRGFEPLAN